MHILVICFTDLKNDQRVNRQIRFLASEHTVTAAGKASPEIPGVAFVPIEMYPKSLRGKAVAAAQLALGRYDDYYWGFHYVRDALASLADVPADLFIANDLETLPLALALAGNRPVIFDAHEYFPRRFEDQLKYRLLVNRYAAAMCKKYAPRAAAMIATSPGHAGLYERDLGIRPTLITNATEYYALEPVEKGPGEPIRLVHHGMALPSRRIELTIEMMQYLDDRFTLDLFLVPGDQGYIERLCGMAEADPRIALPDPVPGDQLVPRTHHHDVGVFLLPPTSSSYRYALPNKLFEYIQARLAVAISPSPGMMPIVQEHALGVIAADYTPQSLAHCLLSLDHERINAYKQNADRAAELFAPKANKQTLLGLVRQIEASLPR